MAAIVSLKLRRDALGDDGTPVSAPYEDVDLDALTPGARALAEAVAATPLRTAADIRVQHERPIRETTPDWQLWHTEQEADEPERRTWRGWSDYPATSTMPPAAYLEAQARRIPVGWHVLAERDDAAAPAAPGMTRDEVLDYLRERGRPIIAGTWTAYVTRGQAPAPITHVGRTPLWDRDAIAAWATR